MLALARTSRNGIASSTAGNNPPDSSVSPAAQTPPTSCPTSRCPRAVEQQRAALPLLPPLGSLRPAPRRPGDRAAQLPPALLFRQLSEHVTVLLHHNPGRRRAGAVRGVRRHARPRRRRTAADRRRRAARGHPRQRQRGSGRRAGGSWPARTCTSSSEAPSRDTRPDSSSPPARWDAPPGVWAAGNVSDLGAMVTAASAAGIAAQAG